MVRLQIQLETAQHRAVKRQARRLGISVSAVIRRSVAAGLTDDAHGPENRARRALALAGRYADPAGETDVAKRHDDILAESYRR